MQLQTKIPTALAQQYIHQLKEQLKVDQPLTDSAEFRVQLTDGYCSFSAGDEELLLSIEADSEEKILNLKKQMQQLLEQLTSMEYVDLIWEPLSEIRQPDFRELARQLRNPEGAAGVKTGLMMQESNNNMIRQTVAQLGIEDNHRLLEIGHGNGSHIEWMLKLADGLHYQGVDISGTMIAEASRLNEPFVNANRVSFVLSDGKSLPFDKNQFDRIFTVNTVYFWEEPDSYLKEIIRTLKPAGVFSLGYGTKNSMNKLPFTQFGFTLYNPEEIEEMIRKAGFNLIGSVHHTEEIVSKSGDRMTRDFSVTTARKPLEI